MSTNYSSAHLSLLSKNNRDHIEKYFHELKFGQNKFLKYGYFIYFIHDDSLSCVKINYDYQTGIFDLLFDGRIINFNRNTGYIVIVDLVNNSHTFLCVGDFFKNPTGKLLLLDAFLYSLIIQSTIQKCNGRRICNLKMFLEPQKMIIQIQHHGRERLDIPSDCISFGDLIRDIRLFFWIQWVSSLVSSFNKYKHLVVIQRKLLRLKKKESFRNPQSIQMLYYGGYLNFPLPNISIIGVLFGKFLTKNVHEIVIMRWVETMFHDIFCRVIRSFFMNFGKFKKSTDLMNKLIGLYPSFKSLKCSSSFIPNIPESLNSLYNDEVKRIKNAEIENAKRMKRRIEEEELIWKKR